MRREILDVKEVENGDEYKVVEYRIFAVWNDGLVEDWSKDLATDSTLAMEIDTYCVDYEELRNQDPEGYNASEW